MAPIQRPTVLVVEDDTAVRRSLQMLLQGHGFDVRAHACGRTLLADTALFSAACLVADYRLDTGGPDPLDRIDGLEILARMRDKGWSGGAILITGYAGDGLAERAVRSGFGAVIEKPMRQRVLISTVMRLIAASGAGSLTGGFGPFIG